MTKHIAAVYAGGMIGMLFVRTRSFHLLPVAAWIIALFLPVVPVFSADPADSLMGDINYFDEEIQTAIESQSKQQQDVEEQQQSELFPVQGHSSSRISFLQDAEPFLSVVLGGTTVVFSDVPRGEWYHPYVLRALESGIVSGYKDADGVLRGLFGPSDRVTVEQLAKIAFEAAGIDTVSCTGIPMNATASDSWSSSYISCAENLGWAVYADGAVDVSRPAMRSEVVATLLQAFNVLPDQATGNRFTDVVASLQFAGFVERAARDGVVSGYTDDEGNALGTFGPEENIQRAEVAKMIVLTIDVYGQ